MRTCSSKNAFMLGIALWSQNSSHVGLEDADEERGLRREENKHRKGLGHRVEKERKSMGTRRLKGDEGE